MKTKKTLTKRIKITKGGKILRKSVQNGHLKVKRSNNRKLRSKGSTAIENIGHKNIFKQLLNKRARRVK